jgi:hypothetical protein
MLRNGEQLAVVEVFGENRFVAEECKLAEEGTHDFEDVPIILG